MLTYPGYYGQPEPRKTVVQVPTVPGFATARLQSIPSLSVAGTDTELYDTQVIIENVGDRETTVQLQVTENYESGPRANLGSAVDVVPLGQRTLNVKPNQTYLEVWTTGSDNETELRVQFVGKIQWAILGFAKDDPVYPAKLWEADVPPLADLP